MDSVSTPLGTSGSDFSEPTNLNTIADQNISLLNRTLDPSEDLGGHLYITVNNKTGQLSTCSAYKRSSVKEITNEIIKLAKNPKISTEKREELLEALKNFTDCTVRKHGFTAKIYKVFADTAKFLGATKIIAFINTPAAGKGAPLIQKYNEAKLASKEAQQALLNAKIARIEETNKAFSGQINPTSLTKTKQMNLIPKPYLATSELSRGIKVGKREIKKYAKQIEKIKLQIAKIHDDINFSKDVQKKIKEEQDLEQLKEEQDPDKLTAKLAELHQKILDSELALAGTVAATPEGLKIALPEDADHLRAEVAKYKKQIEVINAKEVMKVKNDLEKIDKQIITLSAEYSHSSPEMIVIAEDGSASRKKDPAYVTLREEIGSLKSKRQELVEKYKKITGKEYLAEYLNH